MNYTKIYRALVLKAQDRTLDNSFYTEKHHILPKCLGGGNEPKNIVILTAREHFIAHLLLKKMYPSSRGIVFAVFMMTVSNKNHKRTTGKAHEKLRKDLSMLSTGSNNPMYGKTHTPEARKKIAISKIGKGLHGASNGMYGKKRTLESRQKMSETIRGENHPWYGRNHTAESRRKMSNSRKGKLLSEETKKIFSEQRTGEGNSNSKLTIDKVKKIRGMYSANSSLYSQKYLAEMFGVKQAAISKIVTNRTWKHVV
jgi:hypothetical protein